MSHVKGLVVLCLAVAGCSAFGVKPPPAPPRTTHLGLEVQRFAMTNGLRVVVVTDPSATEVAVTMRYRVGAIDDPAGQAGIAHLVEHLMFQQVLGAESLFAHLESATTYFNAETTLDATTYIARANPDKLSELLSIEAVRAGLRCVSVNDSAFEREREVVINELRQRTAATEVREALQHAAYPEGHPYRRGFGDNEASVAAITRAQACSFADAHYAPGNAVLVVSGKVNVREVEAALEKFMAHVPRRAVTAQVDVPAVAARASRSQQAAPIDHDAVLVSWPLPADPLLAIRARTLASTIAQLADRAILGRLGVLELGDSRAPVIAFIAVPADGESTDDVVTAIERATTGVGGLFNNTAIGEFAFDRMKQGAIYELFSSLEEGSHRDTQIAIDVLAARDPGAILGARFQGLRELTTEESTKLTLEQFAFAQAHIVVLKANGAHPARDIVKTAAVVHDVGQRRDPPDPDLALSPMVEPAASPSVPMTTRTLANGMRVVLLPGAAVPTVEMRMIFAAGTGDEPSSKRGVGLLAAHTLTWDYHYLNDAMLFSAAGGSIYPIAGFDRTSFIARGLDMHLDLLLSGLRRIVREGLYEANPAQIAELLHRVAKHDNDDNVAMGDALRVARYGASHPYRLAGVSRYLSRGLTLGDVQAFRAAHYQPANATLVIAGHFDAALANRWIDFLFADWAGTPTDARTTTAVASTPVSLASYKPAPQTALSLALPVRAASSTRASQLIAAEMLASAAEDIRHQLGASYGVYAELSTERLANEYLLGGFIESTQLAGALKLLADRLTELRSDPNAASRAFILARARVVTRLRSLAGGATELARRVEADIALGAPPLSDLQTATAAAALTIDQEMATLADLDLSRAVISLVGPQKDVMAGFAALGRTPTLVGAQKTDDEATARALPEVSTTQNVRLADVEPAITDQGTPDDPLAVSIAGGYAFGSAGDLELSGLNVTAELGHQLGEAMLGLHVELGRLTGNYMFGVIPHDVTDIVVEAAAYVEAEAYDRLFGSVFLGLHVNALDDTRVSSNSAGLGVGLTVGIDLWIQHRSRFAIFGRAQGELISDIGYSAFTIGLAFRHR